MQSSNIPSKIPLPFGYAAGTGYINPIPVASQIGIVNGRASLQDGFPPDTFIPISSGGVPPWGGDMNGILNEITAIQQWQQAGGFFPYDAAFSSAVTGYPLGAVIQSTSHAGFWISTAENNTSNPDTGGAGWVPDAWYGNQTIAISGSSITLTNIQAAYPILTLTGTMTTSCNLIIPNFVGKWIISNATTGAFTIQAKTAGGSGVNIAQGASTYIYGDGTNIYFANSSQVASFNGRTGTVTLNSTDVVNALGYAPMVSFNGRNGSVTLNSTDVTNALGYTPPTPSGSGAYGTWPINITGNASYATNANYASSAGYATNAGTATNAGYATNAGTATTASNALALNGQSKLGLGITGEIWHGVGRAFNTGYVNPYSYPIAVSATATCAVTSVIYAYVNGQLVSFFQWQFNGCGSFGGAFIIVPPYSTYQLNSGQGVYNWVELY